MSGGTRQESTYKEEMKEKDQQMDDLKEEWDEAENKYKSQEEDRKTHQGHEGKEEVQGQEQATCSQHGQLQQCQQAHTKKLLAIHYSASSQVSTPIMEKVYPK